MDPVVWGNLYTKPDKKTMRTCDVIYWLWFFLPKEMKILKLDMDFLKLGVKNMSILVFLCPDKGIHIFCSPDEVVHPCINMHIISCLHTMSIDCVCHNWCIILFCLFIHLCITLIIFVCCLVHYLLHVQVICPYTWSLSCWQTFSL